MAILEILDDRQKITDSDEIKAYLEKFGVDYQQWKSDKPLNSHSPADEILAAYTSEIETLKQIGGYTTVDVIDLKPDTPNLETLLEKFRREHWHSEDEVRFTLEGQGLFYINPQTSSIVKVEVVPGDLLILPAGIFHWFDLGENRRIRAIRLFQDPAGWAPHYTERVQATGVL